MSYYSMHAHLRHSLYVTLSDNNATNICRLQNPIQTNDASKKRKYNCSQQTSNDRLIIDNTKSAANVNVFIMKKTSSWNALNALHLQPHNKINDIDSRSLQGLTTCLRNLIFAPRKEEPSLYFVILTSLLFNFTIFIYFNISMLLFYH
jgi:hypothetical protein